MRGRFFALTLLGTSLLSAGLATTAQAADLDNDYAYEAPRHARRAPVREVIIEHRVVVDHVPASVTVPVGGPVLIVPGLNGPYGPPVYPLLPFSFGYGY